MGHGHVPDAAAQLGGAELARKLGASFDSVRGNLAHVVNHGTHHRAETALLLTMLGNPPRQLDYVFFEIERAAGKPRLM